MRRSKTTASTTSAPAPKGGRFAEVAKGTRATFPVTFPFGDGDERCAVRPLNGTEEVAVIQAAIAFARERGIDDPKPDDELYEYGRWVHTVVLGCVDEADPATPYFADAAEVLEHLDRDRISYLFEQQQLWQDRCCPARKKTLSHAEYKQSVVDMALAGEEDEIPFEKWGPALRLSWVRTSARLLLTLPGLKSASG